AAHQRPQRLVVVLLAGLKEPDVLDPLPAQPRRDGDPCVAAADDEYAVMDGGRHGGRLPWPDRVHRATARAGPAVICGGSSTGRVARPTLCTYLRRGEWRRQGMRSIELDRGGGSPLRRPAHDDLPRRRDAGELTCRFPREKG